MSESQRPLSNQETIREALRLLWKTVLEDRKQILLRVAFALALIAFTFKDIRSEITSLPCGAHYIVALSFLCLLASSVIYFHHYHKAIDVLGALALRFAYNDLGHSDLEIPNSYWLKRRSRWLIASTLFYAGCAFYGLALLLMLL